MTVELGGTFYCLVNDNADQNVITFQMAHLYIVLLSMNLFNVIVFCVLAPDPAANLSINVRGGKSAIVSWNPPALGHYSGFKMKVRQNNCDKIL